VASRFGLLESEAMSCCGATSSEAVTAKKKGYGKGKVALVTGANTGIGKYTAQALADIGFNVVIAGRNLEALAAAKKQIETTLGWKTDGGDDQGRLTILKTPLDLSSVASIKAYAADFLEQKLPLHVLINNAGVTNFPQPTKDGLEYTMGVNWFGGFLLTNLLLDVLKTSKPSRVIIVSSALHSSGRISVENIDKLLYPPKGWSDYFQAYNDSKLANIMHARVLAKKLAGTGVTVYSLHPGVIRTEFGRNLNCCLRCVMSCFSCCFRTISEGAATTVYVATQDGIEGHSGAYFSDCRLARIGVASATDDKTCDALWAKGEELTQKFAQ
jgi:NAD(P)-dependent dehydrogenase (short-subunit alcohol dehydrogenase family)